MSEIFEEKIKSMENEIKLLLDEINTKNTEINKLNENGRKLVSKAIHELKNPLQVISGFSEIIQKKAIDNLSEQHKKYFKYIQNSTEYISELLNNLQFVSNIELDNLELHFESINIVDLIENAISTNKYLSDKKNIKIELFKEKNKILINADQKKINKVINCLLSNAIKFSSVDSKIEVHISSLKDVVAISVKDFGQGIEKSELPNLFKYFGKTSSKTTAGETGSGLELAKSQKIMEKHGSKIFVESEPDKGCVFSFSLPLL